MSAETPTTGDIPTAAADPNTRYAAGAVPFAEKPGDMIGPYKLLQVIGEGGFGTVWLADLPRAHRPACCAEGHQARHGFVR